MDRREFVSSLRKIADFFEHNEVTVPYVSQLDAFVYDKDTLIGIARTLGKCEKGADEGYFYLKKTFGSIQITWNMNRGKVCRRVVVGKKTIPAKVIPEQEVEIVEWHCDPILGDKPVQELVANTTEEVF